jgi:hypothetical protein
MFTPQIKLLMMLGLTLALAGCTFTVTPAPAGPVSPTQNVAAAPTTAPVPAATLPLAAPPTTAPSATAPTRRPTATQPPIDDPTVPGFGSPNGLIGEILLPGYPGALEPIVFQDRIAFRLKVFDPAVDPTDGANIQAVSIVIFDPRGETVLTQTDATTAYCAFDSDAPACPAWVFAEHDLRWPGGTPVCAGQGYQANLNVTTVDGNHTDAFWGFNFGVEGDAYPPCF